MNYQPISCNVDARTLAILNTLRFFEGKKIGVFAREVLTAEAEKWYAANKHRLPKEIIDKIEGAK